MFIIPPLVQGYSLPKKRNLKIRFFCTCPLLDNISTLYYNKTEILAMAKIEEPEENVDKLIKK